MLIPTTWTSMLRMTPSLLALGLLVVSPPTQAGLIAEDDFEAYTPGVLLEDGSGQGLAGGAGWSDMWDVNNAKRSTVSIVSGGLSYNQGSIQIDGGDHALSVVGPQGNMPLFQRGFVAVTEDTVFFSFLIQSSNVSSNPSDDDFIQLGLGDNPSQPRVSVGRRLNSSLTEPANDFFARSSANQNTSVFSGQAGAIGSTHLVVARASKNDSGNYDRVEMWIDPLSADLGQADVVTNHNSGVETLDRLIVRVGFLESNDSYLLDNLRVGTTMQSVMGGNAAFSASGFSASVPEPAAGLLMGLGALAIVQWRHPRQLAAADPSQPPAERPVHPLQQHA